MLSTSSLSTPAGFNLYLTTLSETSPAYVPLPQGISDDILRLTSVTPYAVPIPEHSHVICDYLARENDRLAQRERFLRWAITKGPPPGLVAPLERKASVDSSTTCCTSSGSDAASDTASEAEVVVLSADCSDDGSAAVAAASKSQPARKVLTTVIVRNIPEHYTREYVIDLLEVHGLRVSCDFLYVPVDLNTGKTLGHAFLNFVSTAAAELCRKCVGGLRPACLCGHGEDACNGDAYEVIWASSQQGLNANIKRYRENSVMHASVPDEYKPMLFSDGQRIPFPSPKREIRCPRSQLERPRTSEACIAAI